MMFKEHFKTLALLTTFDKNVCNLIFRERTPGTAPIGMEICKRRKSFSHFLECRVRRKIKFESSVRLAYKQIRLIYALFK